MAGRMGFRPDYISTLCTGFGATIEESNEVLRLMCGKPKYHKPNLGTYEHKPIEHPHIHPDGAIQKQANGIWDLSFYDNGFKTIK